MTLTDKDPPFLESKGNLASHLRKLQNVLVLS